MNDVVPVGREEMKGLRDLIRKWEGVALEHESELVSLRSFRTRALGIYRRLAMAHRANDPITLARLVEEAEQEVVGE